MDNGPLSIFILLTINSKKVSSAFLHSTGSIQQPSCIFWNYDGLVFDLLMTIIDMSPCIVPGNEPIFTYRTLEQVLIMGRQMFTVLLLVILCLAFDAKIAVPEK